jgi:hypothetical protein
MKVQVQRGEMFDDFWREGLLLDSTYLRALVVDGVTPADATDRLKRLKAKSGPAPFCDISAASELTMVYRR